MTPSPVSERHPALDLLRGLALFGVLIVNLLYFFRLSLFEHMLRFHPHDGWLNHAVDSAVAALLEFKAFALFSFLFGVGVAIQAERVPRVEIFLVRRFLALLVVGMCHMVLISNVDILCLYAVCGLALIPLLRLPNAALAVVGVASIYFLSLGGPGLPDLREHAANATSVYGHGAFAEMLPFRWQETRRFILPLLIGVAPRTFGLMLLGLAVWRSGLIRNRPPWLWKFALVAGAVGAINTLTNVPLLSALGASEPLALAYAAALFAWQGSTSALTPIAALGRMALTNYLTQSIVFALLFYGYGFGLFGKLDPAAAFALGVAVYIGQALCSVWWLRRYRFGPFEWLWRSASYGLFDYPQNRGQS